MLSREEAGKRLKPFQIPAWRAKRLAAAGKLPGKLAETGRALLERNALGKPFKNWNQRTAAWNGAIERLGTLSAGNRLQVFAALFPRLAPFVEAAWQLCARLPYPVGHERKAFRAPTAPALAAVVRRGWLSQLISELESYDPDVAWCAAWAPYLGGYGGADALGILLAAAIDAGGAEGEEVFEILRQSAGNEHETGAMGRHVTRALLVCARPEGWEFVEKLLLAAQRQEGLRQVILETIDEAHPEAFRRMVRLILDHNLIRFSATVRAIDVWFGLGWDSVTPGALKKSLQQVLTFLEDSTARDEALARDSGETLYLALWTLAFHDAPAAVKPAAALLNDADVERRFIAVHFLLQLNLPAAWPELRPCLEDPDLRIALRALEGCGPDEKGELFPRLEKLLPRMPAKAQGLPALVWPWSTTTADRRQVADRLLNHLGNRSPRALLPFLADFSSWGRGRVAEMLGKQKKWDDPTREALFGMLGDRDSYVRRKAAEALKAVEVSEADAQRVEAFLARKGSDLRQSVLGLLKKQKTPAALESARRLLGAKKAEQRLGGLELLRILTEGKKSVATCRQLVEEYRTRYPELSEEELQNVEAVLDVRRVVPTLDDALGLMDPTQRSKPVPPVQHQVTPFTPAALGCLQALDELIERHKETPIRLPSHEGEREELLGNVRGWAFPSPQPHNPLEMDAERLPLRSVWEEWFATRPKKLLDKDGLELLRAWLRAEIDPKDWKETVKKHRGKWGDYLKLASGELEVPALAHANLVEKVLEWLLHLHPPAGAVDFLLDATETAFALVPADVRARVVDLTDRRKREQDWRVDSPVQGWPDKVESYRGQEPAAWTEAHGLRMWHLLHWRDQPVPGVARQRPALEYLLAGHRAGVTTEADLYDQLLGPRGPREGFGPLSHLTQRQPPAELAQVPGVRAVVERCRARVVEIELARGETPTAASAPAQALSSLTGLDLLMRLTQALGKKPFSRRGYGAGRAEVLTHLARVTYPGPNDTAEAFAAAVKQAGLSRERLLELAFQAPQWLPHVEHTVGWPGLREGVWWFLAHTPGGRAGVGLEEGPPAEGQPVNRWEHLIRERTQLTDEERTEGAVDVAWFQRVYEPLGKRRWEALTGAAKHGCTDNSYKKAKLLAEVLLGRAKKSDLVAGARDRKLKESVRLLGLLPLAAGNKREADLLGRYRVLLEYRRYARSLGPMSREGSLRAYSIGLENLARTAGYPDPIRLEWAMEAREIADLAAGPVAVTHEGVTVTLTLTEQAGAEISVRRGERTLKAIPATVRKHPKIAALSERRAELKRQASRMKQSLETAMCRGDAFTGDELRQLSAHPVLAPLLRRLVLIGEGVRGYPVASGEALVDHAGKETPVGAEDRLRIAHSHDLLTGGDWDAWQRHCFQTERVQPFKQVFRELYVVTEQERRDGAVSSRYAGQQVNPTQAMALFGARGWTTRDEVSRTFHDAGVTATVSFRYAGWTPLQVEGKTLDKVQFTRRGEWLPLPLEEVPPRVFSEVMRDLDLVVSVAHLGGVDPEASASTVEMRAALLRETCLLLKIENYRFQSNHVLIDGRLGKYSLHLGSGVVHRQPGGSLCIVPVGAQHRGRLFLPFADDDPRTAEVLSKVLLLARDHEIQDPTILDQLR